jgi:type VI secretion system protein ImpC
MIEATDAAIGEMMRRILHHPDFQALEAAWRGLGFLVSRLETDEKVELHILDASKEELMTDLSASDDLRSTGLHRWLVEQTVETPGGEPWALVVGVYTFGLSSEDAPALGRIAKIAVQAGAPFLAEASPHLVGCESLAETPDPESWNRSLEKEAAAAWEALRKLPEASYIGLVLPRMLLRLPYGSDTEPAETFEFEEMPEAAKHDAYLWASPVFACAYVLGETISLHGWDFSGVTMPDIEGLPIHVYRERDESHAKPCAEVTLTEEAVRIILERGVMPLVSFKNQDKVRLARLQSLRDPAAFLAGRWSTPEG